MEKWCNKNKEEGRVLKILNDITKKYLKLNKKRTIVTIIGIVLSGAMISAVTTLAVTFQHFMIGVEIAESGEWQSVLKNVTYEQIKEIEEDKAVKETLIMKPISIAQNEYSDDEFIYLYGYEKEALTKMNGRLIEGRMPQNENEIVLSRTFFDGKENEPNIGEQVTFTLGKRISDGYEMISEAKEENETFVVSEKRTYTVCGKMQKPIFETSRDNYTSGITLCNRDSIQKEDKVDIGLIHKEVKKTYENTENIAKKLDLYKKGYDKSLQLYDIDYNSYVLAYQGVSDELGFNAMLYSVCSILIIVIMIGSILVIYNSFAISVSERKKQFGMLSSIGATKKQIKRSVLYEGVVVGALGIPLGILCGIGGIGITLKIVDHLLQPMFAEVGWHLTLSVSWPSIVIAAALIAFTIYLSVMRPAKRASKISPIEAIRQTTDIKVKAKKLKTRKWVRRVFGISGELAMKNLKRSKKRYRTTVISLVISIVLYLATSGFVGYMFGGFDTVYTTVDYDYAIVLNQMEKEEQETILQKLRTSNVDKIVGYEQQYKTLEISSSLLNEKLKQAINEENKKYGEEEIQENHTLSARITMLDKQTYDAYLKQLGLNELKEEEYILVNYANLLTSYKMETEVVNVKEKDKIVSPNYQYTYDEETGESQREQKGEFTVKIAKVTKQLPFGVEENTTPNSVILITSYENFKKIQKEEDSYGMQIAIKTNNITEFEEELKFLQEQEQNTGLKNAYNIKEQMEQMKNLKLIIEIFLYGFIFLISAIGVSNVFNTISTNIGLRRREFANLKSIGMTNKQFKKMLDLECVFYGTKALLYGIPLGILVCFLLNQAFGNMISFLFKIPWSSIFISIIAIYIVVFATMLYASRKVKKENIIDVIRDDNV